MCMAYISLACDAAYISKADWQGEAGEKQVRTIAYEIEQTKWKFKWQLMSRRTPKCGKSLWRWKVAVACVCLCVCVN